MRRSVPRWNAAFMRQNGVPEEICPAPWLSWLLLIRLNQVTTISSVRPCRVPRFRSVTFLELLRGSDVITLHCPGTAETRCLINRETLAQMKRGVVLVNVARGTIMNQGDLVETQ